MKNIAVCTEEISVNETDTIHLLPAGNFKAVDGRPGSGYWFINQSVALRVVSNFKKRKNPRVIDYEHQTLNSATNGQPAPAAGWFTGLAWRESEGLFANGVEWTRKAKAMIKEKEYKFISVVFVHNKDGEPVEILHAALTNNPALDGLNAVAASFLIINEENLKPETYELLGLKPDATDDEIHDSVMKLKQKAEGFSAEIETLKQKADAAASEMATLKTKHVNQNAMEIVGQLQSEVIALKQEQQKTQATALIEDAIKTGRLLPKLKTWALALAVENYASLKAFIDAAPPLTALTQSQTQGAAPHKNEKTDVEKEVFKNLGIE